MCKSTTIKLTIENDQKIMTVEIILFVITVWIGSTNLGVSHLMSPLLVALCRRKSTRLTAVVGGLVMALALLFASFARNYHQIFLRQSKLSLVSLLSNVIQLHKKVILVSAFSLEYFHHNYEIGTNSILVDKSATYIK